ncbi:hypothetical protein amrb99_75290 [Actinomadura sp. RB99]|uniref:hypothetical protein n=1 Tax=Actinomadura sp. RB99 TaxID=2691577 RepID=UPI0016821356|nr:hypothetical protein [Actinomadura sp. RB99]MBD2898557.1 hypothetical protein [Actinomadura sp. RB99]
MRTGGSRTRSRARVGAIMAGGALAVPPMMLTGASANANQSDVRLLTRTSTSAAAVAGPAYALGHTVRVRAEGGVAHHAVLRLLAADPLAWADRPPGCARLDSGHELRCDLGDVGGATVTRTAAVSVPASVVERPSGTRPSIVTIAAADNAEPRTSRAVFHLPSGEGHSATADAPPAQPQSAPNEGDAHCTADAPGSGKPCHDAAPGGHAAPASHCHKPRTATGPAQPHPANQGRPVHHAGPPQQPHPKPRAHPVQPMPPAQPPTNVQAPAHGKPPAHVKPSGHGKRPHHGTPAGQGVTAYDAPSHHAAPKQHAAPSQQYTAPKQHSVTVDGGAPSGAGGGSGAHSHHTWSYGDGGPSELGVPWDDDAPAAGKHKHRGGTSAGSASSTEDGYPADDWTGTDGGRGYGGTTGAGHVNEEQVPNLPVVPSPGRPGVALPPLNAPGAMPVPNSQAMAGTTSDGGDRGDGRMTLVSPVGMEQGNGTDWAVVLGVAIVAEIGLLWGAACFGLWRRRIALYRAETRAAEARAEAAARGGAYI